MSTKHSPRHVLLSNDDGPPSHESPYVYGLYMEMTRKLGWDVKVVIPSSQKSWIGKAYQIKDTIKGTYYYPKGPDGQGSTSEVSRPLEEGEVGEWILLDGTPATCVNIAIHNIYPGEIDLVISGPNFGRNTSSAFSLSSGTIGAALSGCLSETKAIALSYGTLKGFNPNDFKDEANSLSCKIIQCLWEDWGKDDEGLRSGEVDLYNVNLPMIPELRQPNGVEVVWTTIWRNAYGMLFKRKEDDQTSIRMREAGPDAPDKTSSKPSTPIQSDGQAATSKRLTFHFAPANMAGLVNPPLDTLPYGSDTWAILNAKASITPLRAAFMECSLESFCLGNELAEKGSLVPGRPFKL
ncbi:hypothetical protein FRB94_000689 [Tulasnella sp. JGI-2019a]|nr:hypothetical protein FRB93_011899 [Tulasnella sp. JGI-2019a]KAG9006451.1 hypothetical protein FRB94_000689 [Tulasnella sp. JGI-2019a]KAG9036939.1 hypothetical protein FRB95_007502 [Tulasnella sp. JGI-2019a]